MARNNRVSPARRTPAMALIIARAFELPGRAIAA